MQPTLWRGTLGVLLLGALAGAPMLPTASAGQALLVGTSHQTADAELPATVGIELGIFEKHGLEVKITDFAGGSRLIQAMTGQYRHRCRRRQRDGADRQGRARARHTRGCCDLALFLGRPAL